MGLLAWNYTIPDEVIRKSHLNKAGIILLVKDAERPRPHAPGLGDAIRSGLVEPALMTPAELRRGGRVTPFILLDTNDRRRGLSMVSGREDEEFMKLGVQYYVAARSAVMAQLLPVCGNLYHHSLEIIAFRRKITIDTQRRSS